MVDTYRQSGGSVHVEGTRAAARFLVVVACMLLVALDQDIDRRN